MSYQSILNSFAKQKYFSYSTYLIANTHQTTLVHHPESEQLDKIFDIASLTKIFATGCMLSDAMENHGLNLNTPICEFPKVLSVLEVDHPKTKLITIGQLVSHTSGIMPWAPFYAIDSQGVWDFILEQAHADRQRRYSDVGFILLGKILEDFLAQKIDKWFLNKFIVPLNLKSSGYLSQLTHRNKESFAPTSLGNPFEQQLTNRFINDYGKKLKFKSLDGIFRQHRLQGECNDGNAFFMNQISSHAGLFSTIEELSLIVKHWIHDEPTYLRAFKKLISLNSSGLEHLFCSSDQTLSWNKKLSLIGHHGFTGCSFSLSSDFKTYRIFLSNRQFYGLDTDGHYPGWKKILSALSEFD